MLDSHKRLLVGAVFHSLIVCQTNEQVKYAGSTAILAVGLAGILPAGSIANEARRLVASQAGMPALRRLSEQ